jgi:hypothetical protein
VFDDVWGATADWVVEPDGARHTSWRATST